MNIHMLYDISVIMDHYENDGDSREISPAGRPGSMALAVMAAMRRAQQQEPGPPPAPGQPHLL
jgi:hypothetical protein